MSDDGADRSPICGGCKKSIEEGEGRYVLGVRHYCIPCWRQHKDRIITAHTKDPEDPKFTP